MPYLAFFKKNDEYMPLLFSLYFFPQQNILWSNNSYIKKLLLLECLFILWVYLLLRSSTEPLIDSKVVVLYVGWVN